MNLKKVIPVLIFPLVFVLINTNTYAEGLEGCEEHVRFGVPSPEPVLLCRLGYALSHDADHKVPDWVAYHLTRVDYSQS